MENVNAGAVAEIAALQAKVGRVLDDQQIHAVIIPTGTTLASLATFQYPHGVPPSRIVAAPALFDSASFIDYVKVFRDHRTRIMASPETCSFSALLDYHEGAAGRQIAPNVIAEPSPQFVSHKATFAMKTSDQWKTWIGLDQKNITQADFAEFLEDNRRDILSPTAAEMMEIARDLQATSEVNFASSVRLQSGANQIKYQEVVTAGVGPSGTIEVPDEFSIRIPVFYGEAPVEIVAKLRFRISSSRLTFMYRLYRPAETRDEAFRLAAQNISSSLEMPVWFGRES